MERTTKIKASLSATIVIIASILVIIAPVGLTYADGNIGIILDFGEGKTHYGIIDDLEDPNAYEALDRVCGMYDFSLERDEDIVISIKGVESGTDGRNWNLYVIKIPGSSPQQEYPWVKIDDDPHNVQITDYTAVAWAFCSDLETPSKAVDVTGKSFYGYVLPDRIVSLAPSCTEMICAVGGERKIIGTDDFSNYPKSVESDRESGVTARIGGFTNPNYEKIISLNPKLVICINSQYSHLDIAKKLRSVGIDVLVIDGGEDINSIMEGLMMVGTAINTRETANMIVDNIVEELLIIREKIEYNSPVPKNVMISLSTDNSPWISGSNTYLSDVLEIISAYNSFSELKGWKTVNSESLVKKDIDYIIVIITDGPETHAEYNKVLNFLSDEWKKTDAYENGDIYFLTGSAADLASRPGPRVAQLNELLARIIQDDAFEEDIPEFIGNIPKFIGNEYKDYLSLTKDPVDPVKDRSI